VDLVDVDLALVSDRGLLLGRLRTLDGVELAVVLALLRLRVDDMAGMDSPLQDHAMGVAVGLVIEGITLFGITESIPIGGEVVSRVRTVRPVNPDLILLEHILPGIFVEVIDMLRL
jgi:hypothetical protein